MTLTTPTENIDGTPLADLTLVTLYVCSEEGCVPDTSLQDYPETNIGVNVTMTRTFTPTGNVGETQIVRYGATATDSEDNESAMSNVIERRITFVASTVPPNPPALAGDSAYVIVQTDDRLILLDIGRMSEDTPCDYSTYIRDSNGILAYRVPVANITPYNAGQQMTVAFSQCGG